MRTYPIAMSLLWQAIYSAALFPITRLNPIWRGYDLNKAVQPLSPFPRVRLYPEHPLRVLVEQLPLEREGERTPKP